MEPQVLPLMMHIYVTSNVIVMQQTLPESGMTEIESELISWILCHLIAYCYHFSHVNLVS